MAHKGLRGVREVITVRNRERAYRSGQVAIVKGAGEAGEAAFAWVPGLGSDNPILLHAEAAAAMRAGQFAEAEALYLEAIRISERLFDSQHPHLATVAYGLVELYARTGRTEEARDLATEITGRTDKSRAVVANCRTLSRLADLFLLSGRADDGIELYRKALSHRRDLYGDRHPKIIECLAGFAEFQKRAGNGDQARALLREAIGMLNDVDQTVNQAAIHAVRDARDFIAYAA